MARLKSGITLLAAREGNGESAKKGDTVIYNTKVFFNKGDEVPLQQHQLAQLPASMIRQEDGEQWIDHRTVLGRRQCIAGVEQSLLGMKKGGYRRVRVSPHLAYRDTGIPGFIPPNAVLIIELWVRDILSA